MATSKRLRTTSREREMLLRRYDHFPPMSQRSAAHLLNISPSLLSVWLRRRKTSKPPDRTSPAMCKTQLLEAALWGWMDSTRDPGTLPTETGIRTKARELAKAIDFHEFRASRDWFQLFIHRENVIRKRFRLYDQFKPYQARYTHFSRKSHNTQTHNKSPRQRSQGGDQTDVLRVSDGSTEEEPAEELNIPKLEPRVLTTELDGTAHTVVIPSLWQMKEAMKTLATGLLYRGFGDFQLLHQFEDEVDRVLRRSLTLRTQHSVQE